MKTLHFIAFCVIFFTQEKEKDILVRVKYLYSAQGSHNLLLYYSPIKLRLYSGVPTDLVINMGFPTCKHFPAHF